MGLVAEEAAPEKGNYEKCSVRCSFSNQQGLWEIKWWWHFMKCPCFGCSFHIYKQLRALVLELGPLMSCRSPEELALLLGSLLGVKAAWCSRDRAQAQPRDCCDTRLWPKASESRIRVAQTWHAHLLCKKTDGQKTGKRRPGPYETILVNTVNNYLSRQTA